MEHLANVYGLMVRAQSKRLIDGEDTKAGYVFNLTATEVAALTEAMELVFALRRVTK